MKKRNFTTGTELTRVYSAQARNESRSSAPPHSGVLVSIKQKRNVRLCALPRSNHRGRLTLFILLCISARPSAHESVYGGDSRLSIGLYCPERKIACDVGRPAGEHPVPLVAVGTLDCPEIVRFKSERCLTRWHRSPNYVLML